VSATDPNSATGGAPFLALNRRALPTGRVHYEILLPDGRRYPLSVEAHEDTPELLARAADALEREDRRVKGRAIGTPPA
jgi:hypothetical protein